MVQHSDELFDKRLATHLVSLYYSGGKDQEDTLFVSSDDNHIDLY